MDSSLMYLIEANVLLVVLTVIYFLIRKQLSYRQRRFSLLAIPLLAMVVFLIRLTGVSETGFVYQLPVYELNTLSPPPIEEWQQRQLTFWPAYDRIYLLGLGIASLVLLVRVTLLLRKLRSAKASVRDGLYIIHLEDKSCFSFLNYIQLNPTLTDEQQQLVLEHEKIHVAQKHSYDKLFMSAVQCINWFNPVFIILKKELINVHEYEVDQLMYGRHQTVYMEFLLAYSLRTNSTLHLLTNQFHPKNGLIKRLHFMKKQPKNNWAMALSIPMVAGFFALVSWNFAETRNEALTNSITESRLTTELDKYPEFPGGEEALITYLTNELHYPEKAKEQKIEGTVFVSFVVKANGKIVHVKPKKEVNPLLEREAIRVVSEMPDWIPGEKDGKAVNVEMVLPIAFKL